MHGGIYLPLFYIRLSGRIHKSSITLSNCSDDIFLIPGVCGFFCVRINLP